MKGICNKDSVHNPNNAFVRSTPVQATTVICLRASLWSFKHDSYVWSCRRSPRRPSGLITAAPVTSPNHRRAALHLRPVAAPGDYHLDTAPRTSSMSSCPHAPNRIIATGRACIALISCGDWVNWESFVSILIRPPSAARVCVRSLGVHICIVEKLGSKEGKIQRTLSNGARA